MGISEVPHQPFVDLGDAPAGYHPVAVADAQLGFCSRDRTHEPAAVVDGRETVVQTVPDLDRDRDGPRIEAPRRLSGDVVVGPAFCARSQGGLDRLIQPVAEVALKLRGVGRRATRRPLLAEPVDAECQQLVPLALALALPSTPI